MVLVVDDDPLVLRSLKRRFGRLADTAATSSEAIQKASTMWPAVIILDVNLGGYDVGFQLLPLLKAASPETKVIVSTGNYTDEGLAMARRLGAYSYLEKGDQDRLCAHVAAALADSGRAPPSSSGH